jgi:hypothetical protein
MAKQDNTDLLLFLRPFTPRIQELTLWLRDFVWDLYPESNELIYDNYNAVAFGWSPSHTLGDTFCSIAVPHDKYVHFGFYWGAKMADPKKMLLGNGSQYRYIKVAEKEDFPAEYITELIADAYRFSVDKAKDLTNVPRGTTIVKSISPVKKRPGMVAGKTKGK